MYFLTAMPLWLSAFLCSVLVPGFFAYLAIKLRRGAARSWESPVLLDIADKTTHLITPLVLSFTLVLTWEAFQGAERTASSEAEATMNLYRLSGGFEAEERAQVRSSLLAYTNAVIDKEWPTCRVAKPVPEAEDELDTLYQTYQNVRPSTEQERPSYAASLTLLRDLSKARADRLLQANGSIPTVFYIVLGMSVLLSLFVLILHSGVTQRLAPLVTSGYCMILMLVCFAIIAMDFPYSGELSVSDHALREVRGRISVR